MDNEFICGGINKDERKILATNWQGYHVFLNYDKSFCLKVAFWKIMFRVESIINSIHFLDIIH